MHMTELAVALSRLGWDITVYCAQPEGGRDAVGIPVPCEMDHEGIHIMRIPTLGRQRASLPSRLLLAVTYLAGTAHRVWKNRRRHQALVITTNPPFLGLVGWLMARLSRVPYVFIVYDVYPDIAVRLDVLGARSPLVWAWERVTRLILRGAARVVVIGRDMQEIIRRKMPQGHSAKMRLIANWSDETRVRPVPRDDNRFLGQYRVEDNLVVQYAGTMGRTHNLEPLIEAARLLKERPITFQFVGDGAKKSSLQRMVSAYGLLNVQFVAHQPMDWLPDMLSAADLSVVCLDSRFTGLSVPSKTYGIMASGTAILGFLDPDSEIGMTIAESGCGVVIPDPDGAQVSTTIQHLLDNPGALDEMGKRGRAAFLEKYTLTRAAREYGRLLTEVSEIAIGSSEDGSTIRRE